VGTRFSVSYALSEAFEVEVERGIVSVRVPERSASVELKAGDRLRGHPGRMEVAHAAAKALPSPSEESDRADVPQPQAPAGPAADIEPEESVPSAEWRDRYREGKYAESLTLLRASGAAKHLEKLEPGTLAAIADAARLGGDPELAARALTVLMRRFPRAPEARDGKFLLGRVHALSGDRAAAISAFESYLKPGGSTRYANEAVGRLMEIYSVRGDGERARAMARRYLENAPDGPYRRLARSLVARQN
jgi:TolA-binding protein